MRSTGSFCVDTSDDLSACADLIRQADPDRFMATMAAPVAARRVLFPIYAFNVEVSRAPWVTAEPMIAEMRLQWWRDALDEIRQHKTVRRHQVVTPLADVLDAKGAELLEALVAARRWDIYRDPFEDAGHFDRYLTQTSAHLLLAADRALGGGGDEEAIRDAGHAMGIANWLRAIPALQGAGRVPLLDGTLQGVRALAEDGLARLARARAARAGLRKEARPILLVGWQTGPILRRAASDPAAVAEGRLELSPIHSRLSLMCRAATGRW